MTDKRPKQDPFIQAVIDNQREVVSTDLANGRNPNTPDEFGWIPLHRAAPISSTQRPVSGGTSQPLASGRGMWRNMAWVERS